MFFLPKWLDLSRLFRVEFDIDHDSLLCSNVLLELLTRDIKISALKLGKLIFKESYVPYLLRHRLTLKILWFQCVDDKYEKWLFNFFTSMDIRYIRIDDFTVHSHGSYLEKPYKFTYFGFERIHVSGQIDPSVFDVRHTKLEVLVAHSAVCTPFKFCIETTSNLLRMSHLNVLVIPNSTIDDVTLFGICNTFHSLTELDLGGCVNLTPRGLQGLNKLVNLKILSVAFLDVRYNCICDLTLLEC